MVNEENYEAVGGETSTEGVGRGYDADGPDASADEKAESTADGPLSGGLSDPPSTSPKKRNAPQKEFNVRTTEAIMSPRTIPNRFNPLKLVSRPSRHGLRSPY